MPAKSHQDLEAWQKAIELVELIYRASQTWPKTELYGLTSQIRRAAVSVPSNVSEGQGRAQSGSGREFLRHLNIAYGSLMEVETQIVIAHRLGYVNASGFESATEKCGTVGRLLNGLIRWQEKQLAQQERNRKHTDD